MKIFFNKGHIYKLVAEKKEKKSFKSLTQKHMCYFGKVSKKNISSNKETGNIVKFDKNKSNFW